MPEFTHEDGNAFDIITPDLLGGVMAGKEGMTAEKATDIIFELICEWRLMDLDKSQRRISKFGVKIGVDSSGIVKHLFLDSLGQMYMYTRTGIIRYMEDESGDK